VADRADTVDNATQYAVAASAIVEVFTVLEGDGRQTDENIILSRSIMFFVKPRIGATVRRVRTLQRR